MNTSLAKLPLVQRVASERYWRLLMDADENSDADGILLTTLKKHADDEELAAISRVLAFASDIEYEHGTVPARIYLNHPLRVTTLLAQTIETFNRDTINIALLHNVLEVSDVSEQKLCDIAGSNVARAIKILTVDRAQQHDVAYKNEYYKRIEATSTSCAQVKVADKLDNIYMLCFNPSAEIRNQYLDEIDRWVIPMARRVISVLGERMAEASMVMRETGYLDKNTELEKARRMQAS